MKGTDEVADQETKKSLKDPDYNSEEESNEVLKEYHLTQKKYAEVKKTRPGKGFESNSKL